jgi:peroxiredoxin Q/BCP
MKRLLMALVLFGIGLAAGVQAADLQVGDVAPDFALKASDGHLYKLSDFKGKRAVVLAWYPKAFTSGCTIECESLAKKGDLIKKFDVAYFMVSVDTVEQAKAFGEAHNADFPLLSDADKKVAEAYGTLKDYGGQIGVVSQRFTFYIGKDGKIAAVDKTVHPATSAEDVAAKLAELNVAKK